MSTGTAADTRPVAAIPLAGGFGWGFALALGMTAAGTLLLCYAVAALLWWGTGLWGTNVPFVWGFDLINYVWRIGIANAASLFAAVLVIRRHGLRTAVNRFAEAAAVQYVMVVKAWPLEPLIYAAIVALLRGYRLAVRLRRPPAGSRGANVPRPSRSPA